MWMSGAEIHPHSKPTGGSDDETPMGAPGLQEPIILFTHCRLAFPFFWVEEFFKNTVIRKTKMKKSFAFTISWMTKYRGWHIKKTRWLQWMMIMVVNCELIMWLDNRHIDVVFSNWDLKSIHMLKCSTRYSGYFPKVMFS